MARKIMIIAFFIFYIIAVYGDSPVETDEQAFVDSINKEQSSWTAVKRDVTELKSMIQKLSAADIQKRASQDPSVQAAVVKARNIYLPDSYDASEEYPECDIRQMKNQYQCGCCWAASSSAVMQNRLCIASEGKIHVEISAAYLVACCESCADGCNFGTTFYSWAYMLKHGVVTGGEYGSGEGCYPYPLCPTCPAPDGGFTCPMGSCPNEDYEQYIVSRDKYFVSEIRILVDGQPVAMQEELFENGPICATMQVYEDFMYYKSGIYQHVKGKELGGHNVRLIGYGSENGVDYWIGVNTWADWGEDGSFRILRGVNESGIEKAASAGIPIIPQSKWRS